MIKELRAETLRWLPERVNNRGNCYCDFAPEHDNSETLIAFNITSINPIFDLANHVTLLTFDVEIFITSKNRENIDEIAEDLMNDDIGTSEIFEHIFYREFKDLDFAPKLDNYYCSVLSLNVKACI